MTIRLSGMVSGMDTESIVKEMMTAKRIPLDKLNQQKQTLQWQRDNYREINSKLVDFRNNKILKYNLAATMNAQKAVVTGNTKAIQADANADASSIPMSVKVNNLAEKSSLPKAALTVGMVDGGVKATLKTTLGDLGGGLSTYDLFINKTNITLSKDDTIADVVSKINGAANAKVTASFDEVSGRFNITAKDYGTNNNLKMTNSSDVVAESSLLNLFGMDPGVAPIAAKKASIEVSVANNGAQAGSPTTYIQEFSSENNTITVNGVKMTLLAVSGTDGATEISTQTDTTKTFDTITNFVKDYNDLISLLNTKVSEERYKDFTPLTDEQKKDMKEKDIELWEAKAKSGMLKNDDILKSTLASMRSIITSQLKGLSEMGITTGQYYENGKINIDTDKLKQALQENPQKAISIFQGTAGSQGMFSKMAEQLNTSLDKIVVKAGTSKYTTEITGAYKTESLMGKKLTDFNTRIANLQTRLTTMETNYYKKFTAMETAMNKYNSQSSNLSSYFK